MNPEPYRFRLHATLVEPQRPEIVDTVATEASVTRNPEPYVNAFLRGAGATRRRLAWHQLASAIRRVSVGFRGLWFRVRSDNVDP